MKQSGLRVLAIGDTHYNQLSDQLKENLTEYRQVNSLEDYGAVVRECGYYTWKYGKIDRVESLIESWLEVEAKLRRDFNCPGLSVEDLDVMRTKIGMHDLFRKAGLAHPQATLIQSQEQLTSFGKQVGYPLVLKPDLGVGAAGTFKLLDQGDVAKAFAKASQDAISQGRTIGENPFDGYVAQKFCSGIIVTFDGIVDRMGELVAIFSVEYSSGIMEVVNEGFDMHFWQQKTIDPKLLEAGRKTVAALQLRERWFHLEFFRMPDGEYVVLEANLRAPGSWIVDMMNWAADCDVYAQWVKVIKGESAILAGHTPKRFVAHAVRRYHGAKATTYAASHDEVVEKLRSEGKFLEHLIMPDVFSAILGTDGYITRHETMDDLKETVRFIQKPLQPSPLRTSSSLEEDMEAAAQAAQALLDDEAIAHGSPSVAMDNGQPVEQVENAEPTSATSLKRRRTSIF
jgi:hypothetical protein